jgi:putative transcriptional regulator
MKGPARRQLVALLASALLMLVALPRIIGALKAAETPPRPLAPGVLLVARPDGAGGLFDKTVVLVLEAGGARTWGLVLNRVRPAGEAPLPPGVDRWGGPVGSRQRFTLVRADVAPAGAHPVLEGLAWYEGGREEGMPRDAALTFAGVAAWAPGQLEEELARGAWWCVEGSARAVFTAPEASWAEHAARHL